MKVNRCVCSNVGFEELLKVAGELQIKDADALSKKVDVARNCRLCVPYINIMLSTGMTEIPLIKSTDHEAK